MPCAFLYFIIKPFTVKYSAEECTACCSDECPGPIKECPDDCAENSRENHALNHGTRGKNLIVSLFLWIFLDPFAHFHRLRNQCSTVKIRLYRVILLYCYQRQTNVLVGRFLHFGIILKNFYELRREKERGKKNAAEARYGLCPENFTLHCKVERK